MLLLSQLGPLDFPDRVAHVGDGHADRGHGRRGAALAVRSALSGRGSQGRIRSLGESGKRDADKGPGGFGCELSSPVMMTVALRSVRRPRMGRSGCLSRLWSASMKLLAYCSTRCRADATSSSRTRDTPVRRRHDLSRRHLQRGQCTVEEPSGSVGVAASRDQNVDDLPVLVGGAKWEQREHPNRLVRRPFASN